MCATRDDGQPCEMGLRQKNCPHKVRRKKGKCKEQKRMNGNNPRGIEQKSQEESRNLDPAADQKV